jgi:hypothetical protein
MFEQILTTGKEKIEEIKIIKSYFKIGIAAIVGVLFIGTVYAYSTPSLTLEEQQKVTLIEQKIKGHEAEKLEQEIKIEKLKNEKKNIQAGIKPEVKAPPKKVDYKNIMSRYATGDYYGQCGTFINDYLSHLDILRIFKSSFEDKKTQINYSIEEFNAKWVDGIVAIYDLKNEIGHVSIIKIIDNELWVIDANKRGKNLISKRKYGVYEYKRVIGFFNPYKVKKNF